ncbi:type III-B CRISPR module RAMP protein Cmr6 [Micromonospora gifhornensis]|uniref:CRISPR type III-associated protein domain-containing protein n=1 Tax=Micromonospora gifhornensis TaxID=84594 RepID=A0ABQ4IMQ1_9ACTN|nr:type III-B CRISPR module RAMP protein Cmr6 [Micromonospora gifhornensis]GIJ19182.1 hypothetical protein Vgi01_58660 [Micromonospora gifhornensis]
MNAPYPGRNAAGPIGNVLRTVDLMIRGHGGVLKAGANPLVVLHRAAFVTGRGDFDTKTEASVLRWAADFGLGQEPQLLAIAAQRRARALTALVTQRNGKVVWQRRKVTPQWRMAVGLGNRLNPYEIGLSLHGTYGWPVIPGSTIKGLTCAWARECGIDQEDPQLFGRIFGLPRVGADPDESAAAPEGAGQGSVAFLDALPVGGPATVVRDVVTPHQQPYYGQEQAPGEHHQPIPSEFLVVEGGTFAIDLLGPTEDVAGAAEWCVTAMDELGVGAKTSAGYGYLTPQETQA